MQNEESRKARNRLSVLRGRGQSAYAFTGGESFSLLPKRLESHYSQNLQCEKSGMYESYDNSTNLTKEFWGVRMARPGTFLTCMTSCIMKIYGKWRWQSQVQLRRTGSKQVQPNPTMSNRVKSAFVGLRRDEPNEFASR
jgi:hypothetical protein